MSHREIELRQHRALGLYAMLFCWVRNLDGVAVEEREMKRMLGLQRIVWERRVSMLVDLRPLFPFQHTIRKANTPKSLATLFLSRVSLDPFPADDPHPRKPGRMVGMNSGDRIARLSRLDHKPKIGILNLWPEPWGKGEPHSDMTALQPILSTMKNKDERVLNMYLALLSAGHVDATEIAGIAKEDDADSDD